jgi:hypothetical protein
MNFTDMDWATTTAVLLVVGSIFASFVASGFAFRAKKLALAATAPFWVFVPAGLLVEWWVRGGISPQSALFFVGFALLLSLATWLQLRSAR